MRLRCMLKEKIKFSTGRAARPAGDCSMIWINGVWDAAMQRKMAGFAGLFALFLLAYAGAAASGAPFALRLIF